jgi:hypothetical protein
MVDLEHRENERLNNKTVEEVSLSSSLNFFSLHYVEFSHSYFLICKLRGKPGVNPTKLPFFAIKLGCFIEKGLFSYVTNTQA